MKLYEDEAIRFDLDEKLACLVWHTKRPLNSEEARKYLRKSMELRTKHRGSRKHLNVLLDIRKAAARDLEDFLFYIEHHVPVALDTGLTHVAIVSPDNIYGQATYEGFLGRISSIDSPIQHELFHTVEQARQWLKNL